MAADCLLQSRLALRGANEALSARMGEEAPLDLSSLGITGTASSPALSARLQALVGGVVSLDASSSDVHALVDSLSSLHTTAERSVWRVRRLDEQRRLLQAALERVEDLLDLRACLAGLAGAQASGDRAAMALNVSRFRALARTLPMPEGDLATVAASEQGLLAAVTQDFDAAIADQQALSSSGGGGGGAAQAPDYAAKRAAAEATIATCCQLLSLLGRGFVGVERYAAYLRATLSSDISAELRRIALTGVDFPCAALNAASALFARAADTLQHANVLGGSLFDSSAAAAPSALTSSSAAMVVHSVVDGAAARVVLSAVRSGRVAAALAGRETLRSGLARAPATGKAAAAAAASAAAARAAAQAQGSGATATGAPLLPPHLAEAFCRALEAGSAEAPFALPPLGEGAGAGARHVWEPTGEDFTDCTTLDMFLDEQALLLQRCASYWRLIALGSGSAGGAHARLAGATSELVSVYCALEAAGTLAGIARAVAMDELLEDGAAGVAVDLLDPALPVTAGAGAGALGSAADSGGSGSGGSGGGGGEAVGSASGAGAMVSTLVEDVFFVLQRAGRRAFATGSAEAAASVVNNALVMPLMERLGNELDVRFRGALGQDGVGDGSSEGGKEGGKGGSSSSSSSSSMGSLVPPGGGGGGSSSAGLGLASPTAAPLTPDQWERLAHARKSLMATPMVRASSARIGGFQSLASPGQGGEERRGEAAALGTGLKGAAGGAARAPNFASPGGPAKLGGGEGSGAGVGSGALGTEPVARLTEEAAGASLALNITQLAAECTLRLKASLEAEAVAVFSAEDARCVCVRALLLSCALLPCASLCTCPPLSLHNTIRNAGRELSKVKASLSGLSDCALAFRRALETGLSTLAARLTPRLRSACNLFEGASSLVQYELSEAAYAAACAGNHAFSTEFLPVLAAMLAPYQFALTPSLARSLLLKVATYTAKQLEPRLRRKRFNLLGALQLEADARLLVNFFVSRAGRGARERLARILAIARILACETAAEAGERFKDGSGEASVLSKEDLAAILKQRVDLK